MKNFHKQGIFQHLWKFSKIKEPFYNQGTIPQSKNFSIEKGLFHSCDFSYPRKFSTKKNLFDQDNFTQAKSFLKSRKFSTKKKICSHKNIFNPLMLFANKKSYVLTRTISFLSTRELLLLNIKKLILYNVLTECTSMQTI